MNEQGKTGERTIGWVIGGGKGGGRKNTGLEIAAAQGGIGG
jgi:hypothetical protein